MLTFQQVTDCNIARCIGPRPIGFSHPLRCWSLLEWAGAMAGEAGEACNVAKKLIRVRDGLAFMNKEQESELLARFACELADTILYADLSMSAAGFDTGRVVAQTFNQKSEELGSSFRLPV